MNTTSNNISGAAPAAVAPQGEWRIDTSAGREILVYKNCSVIEDADARYVLSLIAAASQPAAVAGPAWGALRALSARWLVRAADALPVDAMLINKHIRELSEVLAAQPGETAHDAEIAGLEASCATLGRLVDDLRPDGERLEWLLRRLSGSALRAYIGIAGDTGDMETLRTLIDAHRGTASAPAPALEAPAAPAVPAGFALVPIEPTQQMLDAGRWSGAGSVSIQEEWARKEVWNRMLATITPPPAAYADDLIALVTKLVQALRKAAPDNDLAGHALDYLKRNGLQGSPLRAAEAAPQAPAAPSIAVVTDEQIDAILDSPGGLGMVIADKRERMRMFARRVLDLAAPAAPAVDALDSDRWRALEGQMDAGRVSLTVHHTEAEQWDGRTISDAGELQDYADSLAAQAKEGGEAC